MGKEKILPLGGWDFLSQPQKTTPSDGMDARWREGKKKAILINFKHPLETVFKYLTINEYTDFFELFLFELLRRKR
ncbi:MAG: hypothetical protein DRP54_04465 [Spirochaetes bacterium]|nr:MAG: hypothetical protein DRP54_04465 [Spirochaetota bacterium]